MNIDEYLEIDTYSLSGHEKRRYLLSMLNTLNKHHEENCKEYRNFIESLNYKIDEYNNIEELLYLPVRIFKNHTIKSCSDKEVIKVLTSSGTTSQNVSKIYLDKKTSFYQTKALVKIMQNYIGTKRLPMLIIDSKDIIKNRSSFSARGAGIIGLSNFGKHHTYALNENMEVNYEEVDSFLKHHINEKILIFGFTYMIWQYLYKNYNKINIKLKIENSVLIHSGGWKKLTNEAVDNHTFKESLKEQFRITDIHDFYGMVEQVGSIFVECECGYLHTPIFADIIIRDMMTLKPLEYGKEGIIEVISILPVSYPGHVLLTEDIGFIIGEDDCKCGKKGKYFKVLGRLAKAEIRGCSDTHAFNN